MPVLTYSSETVIWRQRESSRIKAVWMDNLRGLRSAGYQENGKSLECMDKAFVWSDEGCG